MGTIPSSVGLAEVVVKLQIGDTASIPGVALYDSGLYDTDVYGEAGEAYMRDVTEWTEAVPSIVTGRQKYTGRFRTGVCTIELDNTNGQWTPSAGAPLPGFLPLRPGRLVQIFVRVAPTVDIQIYEGFVDTITDRYGRDGNLVTSIKALDVFSLLTLNDLPAVPPEGSGEMSYQRAQRILDHHFDTPPALESRQGSGQWTTMQPTELAQPALQELQVTAASEGGETWVAPNGDVVFVGMEWFRDRADGPPAWVVGGASPIKAFAVANTDWSASRIRNEAHYARAGGTEQVVENTGSVDKYGRRTHTRLDLETDDDQRVLDIATRLVTNLADDRAQVTGMTLQPSNLDEVLMGATATIGQVILLSVETIHAWSYTVKTQIVGIRHVFTTSRWQVAYLLDDTEIEVRGAFSSGFSDGFDV